MATSPQLEKVVRIVRTFVQDVQTRGTIDGIRSAYEELASQNQLVVTTQGEEQPRH